MPEKLKPRGGTAKPRRDKSRTPSRAPSRASKRPSRKPSPQPTPATPAEDGRGSAPKDGDVRETLDVGDILDELLDRVINESALAALLRQRVPFAVSRVRDAILYIAEWRFPPRDESDPDPAGDPERDGVWSEDEEPETCPWDSWAEGVVSVLDVPVPSGEVPCQDLLVTAEVPGIPLPSEQVPDAKSPRQEPPEAAGAHPAEVPGAVTVLPVPGPPRPEPSIAPRPPGRDTRLARPPRPRPAPLCPPRPPEPPGGRSREATTGVGLQVPPSPTPSSRGSVESIEPLTLWRGRRIVPGVPRLGVRRGAPGWVTPEVKVLDVAAEFGLLRAQGRGSRGWMLLRGSLHVLAGPPRRPRTQPQLCDPWLAAAQLAPGVTVRCGGTERRGPGTAGHEQEKKEEEKRGKKLERELKPIRRYPVCRMSEEGEW